MQAVRNSTKKEFKDQIMATLIERADHEGGDTGIKLGPVHQETAKI